MLCPRCHRETPTDAEFCPGCGSRLLVDCAKCGTPNGPDHNYCKKCGRPLAAAGGEREDAEKFASPRTYTPKHLAEKILTSRGALEGERKQVTVLFADISGFTALSERLDPEEIHRLMTQTFELMLAEVHRYEGTVNQFLGDGIMALFGAPIGHEDHAERAVRAALGIRKALDGFPGETRPDITLVVRQGLNTGLVVVGSIGNDLRMDYTAVGDTTNVAARLQQAAEPGRIVISEATHRLVGGYLHTRPLGQLSLKGKTEPIGAWEVISRRASRTRLEVKAEQGLTPFVGREQESRVLFESFEKAKTGEGQVVFLAGEPGIGKSRLLFEFRRRLGEDCTWLEGHCVSFGRSIAFHPLIDLLKRNFRIEDGDGEDTIVRKIERGVLLLGEDLRPTLPYFRSLLSVDPGEHAVQTMDPRQRRGEIFNALRLLTHRASEVRPQVLVLEDLHWMDKATEEYILFAADSVPSSRALCILTYRTAYAHPLGDRSSYTRLGLSTLSTDDSAQMASALLGTDRLPEELKSLIMAKTEGNPFFVEEVVKSLRELGVIRAVRGQYELVKRLDEITVPDTIQDVITARVDRLDDRSKKTLQTAAVIGREFSLALLEQTMQVEGGLKAQVDQLKRFEFIYEKRFSPDRVYTFRHSLTQEVAYEGLLVQRRQELHHLIARMIETSYADRLPEQYQVLAYHYSRAHDATKAVEYLVKAGDRAVVLYANTDALGYYAEALAQLAKQQPSTHQAEQRIDIIMRLCGASGSSVDFERDLRNLSDAMRLAKQIGDRRRESQILYWTGRTIYLTGRPAEGTEYAEHSVALADELGDESLAAMPVNLLGRLYFLQSEFEKNVRMLGRSAALFERDGNRIEEATARGGLGWSLAVIGQFDRALEEADRGVAIAEHTGHLPTEAACYMYRACARFPRGEWRRAIEDARRSLSIAVRLRDAFREYLTSGFLGGFLVMAGEFEEGLALIAQAVQAGERLRTKQGLGSFRVFLAEAGLSRGDVAEAGRQCQEAIAVARGQSDRWCEAWARRVLAETFFSESPPNLDAAEHEILEAIRVQREVGALPDLARSVLTYGRILKVRGQGEQAREAVTDAMRMFKEMGMTWDLARAEGAGGV
jgi:class 3 adenylate cyclase/tetratricopeptide (TPR) repeat protein